MYARTGQLNVLSWDALPVLSSGGVMNLMYISLLHDIWPIYETHFQDVTAAVRRINYQIHCVVGLNVLLHNPADIFLGRSWKTV